jgi:hypothetical protein
MRDRPAGTVRKLAIDMDGDWTVTTRDSRYEFHLAGDDSTVTRIPGPHARELHFDQTLPLESLNACMVLLPGYWIVKADENDPLFESLWTRTSVVLDISPRTLT